MSEFMLWFWRPLAEVLGALFVIFVVACGYAAIWFGLELWSKWKKRPRA